MSKPNAPEVGSTQDTQPDARSVEQINAPTLNHPEATTTWLEGLIADFQFDVTGLARAGNKPSYPLPTEPGTLANILEVSAAGYLARAVHADVNGIVFRRGGQREYPDIELSGGTLGDLIVAVDIKVARRNKPPKRQKTERRTKARITLLTGNTYFAKPQEKHASLPRPYGDYAFHIDWVILFSIDESAEFPEVTDIEHVIAETWQIASKSRSSTTRSYIGAVNAISALKEKRGEFASRLEFETFWRSFDWAKKPTAEEKAAEADAEFD